MGMGLNGISDWSPQLPFIDLMKQSRKWFDWDNNKSTLPIHTDKYDWITKLEPGQTLGTVFLTSKSTPTYLNYFVYYEGDGLIEYHWAATKNIEKSSKGKDYITVNEGSSLLKITKTNPLNPIKNIQIIAVEHLENFRAKEIFNPDWVAIMQPFRANRYMDWMRTNDSAPYKWENRPALQDRSWGTPKGVPIEVISTLSNQLHSIPWINIPHWAPMDFTNQIAQTMQSTLDVDIPIYIEHSNEVWNWQFKQAHHALSEGKKLWGEKGDAYMQWHGVRTAEICDEFKTGAFAKTPERIICTIGVQTGWKGLERAALDCPLWKEAPCYKHGIDAIAVATYFDAKLNGPHEAKQKHELEAIRTLAAQPDNIKLAFKQINNGSILPKGNKDEYYNGIRQYTANSAKYWSTVAKKHNLSLVAYEGGQHITANGQALQEDQKVTDFHIAINRSPLMENVYTIMLDEWKSNGGGLHMHYVDVSTASKWGSWGALENLKQSSSPKFKALIGFNENNPCWWQLCKEFPIERDIPLQ